MANRAWPNYGHHYDNLTLPALVSMNFIVDSSNGNGLGIRSLKSNGYIKHVYMHTSATPMDGNPNPESGVIVIQMADNYAAQINGFSTFTSPLSGSNLAVDATNLTPGDAYVITVLGTSTAADWLALGVPAGITPAVGVSFIALVSGTGAGSGMVQAPSNSGIDHMEVIGDPNHMNNPQGVSNQGAWIIMQCLKDSVLTAPNNNTVISLSLLVDNSSVTVDGL